MASIEISNHSKNPNVKVFTLANLQESDAPVFDALNMDSPEVGILNVATGYFAPEVFRDRIQALVALGIGFEDHIAGIAYSQLATKPTEKTSQVLSGR